MGDELYILRSPNKFVYIFLKLKDGCSPNVAQHDLKILTHECVRTKQYEGLSVNGMV